MPHHALSHKVSGSLFGLRLPETYPPPCIAKNTYFPYKGIYEMYTLLMEVVLALILLISHFVVSDLEGMELKL